MNFCEFFNYKFVIRELTIYESSIEYVSYLQNILLKKLRCGKVLIDKNYINCFNFDSHNFAYYWYKSETVSR